jgi:hypothetical protein
VERHSTPPWISGRLATFRNLRESAANAAERLIAVDEVQSKKVQLF